MMKNILILLITIGVMVSSCGTGEPTAFTKYVVKNNSSYDIELTIFNFEIRSLPNIEDTTFRFSSGTEIFVSYGGAIGDSFYPFPFGSVADSAFIVFNNERKIIYRRNDGDARNIFNLNNWVGGSFEDDLYEYEYSITNVDYENGILIE